MGPTGVGKTELARALAEFLFDDEHAMDRWEGQNPVIFPSLVRRRLAIDGGDGAYVALAARQTVLEIAATGGRAWSLRLDNGRRGRGWWGARIGTGTKWSVANSLTGCITKTGRKRCLLAGRNWTSIDTSLNPRPENACYWV
jgi:hypothetical protein